MPDWTALRGRRKSVVSVLVTLSLLASLVAFATPTAAVSTTLLGPNEVEATDTVTLTATVDIESSERIPIEAFVLEFQPTEGASDSSVAVTFLANGTIVDVDPAEGVIGNGQIRIQTLRKTLAISPVARDATFARGERVADDPNTGEEFDFGYGYGFADGSATDFQYEVMVDTHAFKQGGYTADLSVDTGTERAFASESLSFEVTAPSRGNGSADGTESSDDRGPPADRGQSLDLLQSLESADTIVVYVQEIVQESNGTVENSPVFAGQLLGHEALL